MIKKICYDRTVIVYSNNELWMKNVPHRGNMMQRQHLWREGFQLPSAADTRKAHDCWRDDAKKTKKKGFWGNCCTVCGCKPHLSLSPPATAGVSGKVNSPQSVQTSHVCTFHAMCKCYFCPLFAWSIWSSPIAWEWVFVYLLLLLFKSYGSCFYCKPL